MVLSVNIALAYKHRVDLVIPSNQRCVLPVPGVCSRGVDGQGLQSVAHAGCFMQIAHLLSTTHWLLLRHIDTLNLSVCISRWNLQNEVQQR